MLDAAGAKGRMFPVSPSVTHRCALEKEADPTCTSIRIFISNLQMEPRSIPWARDREQRIEEFVESQGPGRFVIRSLECRTNRCAVEVVGVDEPYSPSLSGDAELEREFISGASTLGFERAPHGQRLVVTVMGYKRRSEILIVNGKVVDN
jgi:hypothetical protein